MLDRLVSLHLLLELPPLEPRVGRHALRSVRSSQLEDGVVHSMETRERYELEIVPYLRQLSLKRAQLLFVEPTPPVERGGAVVGEQLFRIHAVNGTREPPRLFEDRGG